MCVKLGFELRNLNTDTSLVVSCNGKSKPVGNPYYCVQSWYGTLKGSQEGNRSRIQCIDKSKRSVVVKLHPNPLHHSRNKVCTPVTPYS